MKLEQAIALVLEEAIEDKGISVYRLCLDSKVSRTTVDRMLAGKFTGNSKVLKKVFDELGIKMRFSYNNGHYTIG